MNIRLACWEDLDILKEWRNEKTARAMSLNSKEISSEEHERWFKNALAGKTHLIYIGEKNGHRIGVCRFKHDSIKKISDVSVAIAPEFRNQGFASELLRASMDLYQVDYSCDLHASIRADNEPSKKLFKGAGYFLCSKIDGICTYICPHIKMTFTEIKEEHADVLYELLERRDHFISHETMPNYDEHL